MNTITLNQNPPYNLGFTHDLDWHKYLQPRHGYKGFLGFLGLALFLSPITLAIILSEWRHHAPIEINSMMFCFLSIIFSFVTLLYFPLCQQTRTNKAIIWLPAKENNPQFCLHIRSQNWHRLLAFTGFFFFLLMLLGAANFLGSIPPTQALQPWNWIRITPINIKVDLACLTADTLLIFLILIPLFYSQWHIIYTPQTLHIYHARALFHHTTTILNQPWEQLTIANLLQCNAYNPDKPQISSTITLKNGQEKTFKLPANIFADPCWMTFTANTLTNLTNTTSRQNFLTNLHQHVPTKAKTRNTKP